MFRKTNPFVWMLLFVILVGLACSSSTQDVADAVQDATAAATAVAEQAAATDVQAEPTDTSPPEPTATDAPPTATPLPAAEELQLGMVGFVQDGDSILVSVTFLVTNPNAGYAIEDSEYQISVFDASDQLIETSSGYLELVLPGDTIGYSTSVFLDDDQKANRVEVQLFSGDPEPLELEGAIFQTTQVNFIPSEYFPSVTGVIKNELDRNITNLRLTAVLYNEAGDIIGGGYTYLNFLGPAAEAGVDINVEVTGQPALIEIYPTVSGLSVFEDVSGEPPALQVLSYGAGQDGRELGVGFIVENISEENAVGNSEFLIAVYNETGNVLASDEGYIELVFPGEQQAVFSTIYLPEGERYDRIDIQLNPGKAQVMEIDQSPFSSENLFFAPSQYFPRLTGVINNSHDEMITNIKVTALAYDAEDNIIGGGYTYADFVPANGAIPVSFSLTFEGAPARFELSSALSGLGSFTTANDDVLTVTQSGFGQDGDYVGVGYIVVNNVSDEAIPDTEYRVAAYDADGVVIGVETGYLPIIFPGQETGIGTIVSLIDNTTVARVEIQLNPDEPETLALASLPLTADQVAYSPSSFSDEVSGVLQNAHTAPFDSAYVYVIAYDADGNIIGGGYDYVSDTLTAGGQVAFEARIYVAGPPDRVEAYPALSRLE